MHSILRSQLLLLLLVAACNPRSDSAQRSAQASAVPDTQMPPAIAGERTYSCGKKQVVRLDYFEGDRGAFLEVNGDGRLIALTATGRGGTLTGQGHVVTGRGSTIWVQRPGGPLQRCRG